MADVLDPNRVRARVLRIEGLQRALVVAYSGGVDSHVLLHALAVHREPLPVPLRAVHVHHGLHPQAERWAEHCSDVCEDLGIPLQVLRVSVPAGASLEAQARRARYAAFEQYLRSGEVLLTGHHRGDQAETLLLRALRGAGVDGLAAMPAQRPLGPGILARPLLDVDRDAILAYAHRHGLQWVDDPANHDPGHDRNFLRHRVLPLLRERWPAADQTLASLAEQAWETRGLLAELAALDGLGVASTLGCERLRQLSDARARNLVRTWLRRLGLPTPPRRRLRQGLRDLLAAGDDRQPLLQWPGGRLRRYRDRLYADDGIDPPPLPQGVVWRGQPRLRLPAGVLHADPVPRGGLCPALASRGLILGPRLPGERCRPLGRGERSVKQLFQEAGIPPWHREHWPLLRRDGRVLAIPGVCLCEGAGTAPGETGLRLAWEPAG